MRYWTQTPSGRAFDYDSPWTIEVDPLDIAHCLSQINRYNGSTRWPISVAQHSVMMADVLCSEPYLRKCALLHDAPEAYTGDIPTPLKKKFHDTLGMWLRQVDRVVYEKLGLPPTMPAKIHTVDRRMLVTERNQLLGKPPQLWDVDVQGVKPYPDVRVAPWDWTRAKREFIDRMERYGVIEVNREARL